MAQVTVFWMDPRQGRNDIVEAVRDAGCRILLGNDYDDREAVVADEDLMAVAPEVHGIMLGGRDRVPREALEAATQLVVVSKTGIGVDRIDIEAATELGIVVTNTPVKGHVDAVAEFAVALLLGWAKQLTRGDAVMRAGRFDRLRLTLLAGKTVGVVGFGRIGRRVGEILRGLGMEVISYDPYVAADETAVSFDDLLARSDVVTLHAAGSDETDHLIDAVAISKMKSTAVLVNTARGRLVDEQALAAAIREGRLGGAALNVFEQEPPPVGAPLLDPEVADKVLVTPHGAGQGVPEIQQAMPTEMVRIQLAALRGIEPEGAIVNPEVLPRWRGRTAAPLADIAQGDGGGTRGQ